MEMKMAGSWFEPIWQEFERSFQGDWTRSLSAFNGEPEVCGKKVRFSLPLEGQPPVWFMGDIEALVPEEWVLVVSLNPPSVLGPPLSRGDGTPQAWWDTCRTLPRNWSGGGVGRCTSEIVMIAAEVLGADVSGGEEAMRTFAAERMLFVDFCPYGSQRWPSFKWDTRNGMKNVAARNEGPKTARRIRQHLFDRGQPKVVFCLGQFATWDVKDRQFGEHRMFRMEEQLKRDRQLTAVVYEGVYTPPMGPPFRAIGIEKPLAEIGNGELYREVLVEMGRHGSDSLALIASSEPHSWEKRQPRS